MSESPRHLTSLDLDLLELGALGSAVEEARIREHLASCLACTSRWQEHAASVTHFRSTIFPRTAPGLGVSRATMPSRLRRWVLALALPAVALAAVPLFLPRLLRSSVTKPASGSEGSAAESAIGIKGSAALHVFAKLGRPAEQVPATVVKVVDGTRLAAGDALRFVLDPTGLPYLLIASVDGAGQVSIYYPYRGERSAQVDGRATVSVPDSIVLDQALGPERVFAVFSSEPVSADQVRQALAGTVAAGAPAIRAQRHLPIAGTVQATVLFEKEPVP